MKQEKNIYQNIFIYTLFFATLTITPFFSFDAVNIPKFIILTLGALLITPYVVLNYRILFESSNKPVLVLIILFIVVILISQFTSKMPFSEKIYGVSGRQTGAITYIALAIFMLMAMLISNVEIGKKILFALLVTGIISGIYGVFQVLQLDPVMWNNPYGRVIGMLGNPNFQSSFLSIAILSGIGLIFYTKSYKNKIILSLSCTVMGISVIYTNSIQGLIIFVLGIFLFSLLKIKFYLKSVKVLKFLKFICLMLLIYLVFILFNLNYFSRYLQSSSLLERLDLWRASLSIIQNNLLFGVGFDGFRDNFFRYRDSRSVENMFTQVGDSPHNLILDIGVSSGILGLSVFVILQLSVLKACLLILKNLSKFEPIPITLIICWVGFWVQAMISPGFIPILLWGWVLGGALIGISHKTSFQRLTKSSLKLFDIFRLALILIGLVITLPLINADSKLKFALASGIVPDIQKSVNLWPQSVTNFNMVAQLFLDGGFPEYALNVSRRAVVVNPDNVEAWRLLAQVPGITNSELINAKNRIRQLDPLGALP